MRILSLPAVTVTFAFPHVKVSMQQVVVCLLWTEQVRMILLSTVSLSVALRVSHTGGAIMLQKSTATQVFDFRYVRYNARIKKKVFSRVILCTEKKNTPHNAIFEGGSDTSVDGKCVYNANPSKSL